MNAIRRTFAEMREDLVAQKAGKEMTRQDEMDAFYRRFCADRNEELQYQLRSLERSGYGQRVRQQKKNLARRRAAESTGYLVDQVVESDLDELRSSEVPFTSAFDSEPEDDSDFDSELCSDRRVQRKRRNDPDSSWKYYTRERKQWARHESRLPTHIQKVAMDRKTVEKRTRRFGHWETYLTTDLVECRWDVLLETRSIPDGHVFSKTHSYVGPAIDKVERAFQYHAESLAILCEYDENDRQYAQAMAEEWDENTEEELSFNDHCNVWEDLLSAEFLFFYDDHELSTEAQAWMCLNCDLGELSELIHEYRLDVDEVYEPRADEDETSSMMDHESYVDIFDDYDYGFDDYGYEPADDEIDDDPQFYSNSSMDRDFDDDFGDSEFCDCVSCVEARQLEALQVQDEIESECRCEEELNRFIPDCLYSDRFMLNGMVLSLSDFDARGYLNQTEDEKRFFRNMIDLDGGNLIDGREPKDFGFGPVKIETWKRSRHGWIRSPAWKHHTRAPNQYDVNTGVFPVSKVAKTILHKRELAKRELQNQEREQLAA